MKKLTVVFIIVVVFSSCKKEEFIIENLNRNTITALGHAGMGNKNIYPTNSYESILKCLNLGMDGTEMDVQLTKDGVLVAYHGYDLSDATNMSGIINSMTWDEIKSARYTGTPYLDYSVISVDQLFSSIPNIKKYKFTFDCKLYSQTSDLEGYNQTFMTALTDIIEKYDIGRSICIESGNIEFLKLFKKQPQHFKLFIYPDDFESGLAIAKANGLYGITISTNDITSEQIKLAHDNNIRVAIWGVGSESENADAINKNPDFIQTDDIAGLIYLLK